MRSEELQGIYLGTVAGYELKVMGAYNFCAYVFYFTTCFVFV